MQALARGARYSGAVGRLENIIARNQQANRPRERVIVSLVFGGIILLIIALMVFTDLGASPVPSRPPTSDVSGTPDRPDTPGASSLRVTPSDLHDKRINHVLLRKAPSHPAPAANPTPTSSSNASSNAAVGAAPTGVGSSH